MQIQNTMKQARIIIVIIIIIIFSIFFNIRSLLSKTYEPNIAILMWSCCTRIKYTTGPAS